MNRLNRIVDPLDADLTIGGSAAGAPAGSPVGTPLSDSLADAASSALDIFHGYIGVFVVAFLVTLLATPLMRRLALANGVVDHPSDPRKMHRAPVAYLGGVAVYLGLLAGVAYSYLAPAIAPGLLEPHASAFQQRPIPLSVLGGMTAIMLAGLADDVLHISPRIKVAGQLLAAAALALDFVGVKVAAGVMRPIGRLLNNEELVYLVPVPSFIPIESGVISVDLIYWAGTAIIAIFVLGACNASNLMDGLDGLLTGITSIAAAGFLIIALTLATLDDGNFDSARVALCLCLLGACLGFLPHNFNPASIFLGDCGSLLLGFVAIVVVLSLGDTGKTPLVVAGLLIYSLPMIDTTLAIVRRKMAGMPISSADDQHLHHMLKRIMGVKGAVFALYGIAAVFAALGILVSLGRGRVAYTIAMVFAAFIGVTAVKMARRSVLEAQAAAAPVRERDRAKASLRIEPARTAPVAAEPEHEPAPKPV